MVTRTAIRRRSRCTPTIPSCRVIHLAVSSVTPTIIFRWVDPAGAGRAAATPRTIATASSGERARGMSTHSTTRPRKIHPPSCDHRAVDEIRAIDDDELERWVATMRAVDEDTGTVEDYRDWRRQAGDSVWLLASDGRKDIGAAVGVVGWTSRRASRVARYGWCTGAGLRHGPRAESRQLGRQARLHRAAGPGRRTRSR